MKWLYVKGIFLLKSKNRGLVLHSCPEIFFTESYLTCYNYKRVLLRVIVFKNEQYDPIFTGPTLEIETYMLTFFLQGRGLKLRAVEAWSFLNFLGLNQVFQVSTKGGEVI